MKTRKAVASLLLARFRRRSHLKWTIPLVLALLLVTAAVYLAPRSSPVPEPRTLAYSTLLQSMAAGQVDSIAIAPGREIVGWLGAGAHAGSVRVVYSAFEVDDLVRRAEAARVPVSFVAQAGAGRGIDYLNLGLTVIVLAALGFFLLRQMKGPPGLELDDHGAATGSFGEVAGNEGAVAELREIVEFLRSPEKFIGLGARTPKGVLLFGPPGTGKTLMARAVAGEAGVRFWTISGSEVTGFLVGIGVVRIKALFRKARKRGGVIFIDEIDALGGRRGRQQSHNEDDRTLNQLLVEMDGFAPSDGVVVIGATNRPEDLDPALLRAGRFDRSISVGLPTAIEREAILRLHVSQRKVPVGSDVDLRRLAKLMPQTSGADLATLINEAAIAAGRVGAARVEWRHVEYARDRLLLGKERTGFRATDEEWRTVAVHEAGHAVAGVLCCPEDGLHKVTIQPRGQAMGVAFFSPDDDRHLHSRRYLEGQILKALGGRAAEEVVFGAEAITSGARSDLQQATRIAKEMVYHLGMGESTGLMILDQQNGPVSSELHTSMDRQVREMLDSMYERVRGLIQLNRDALEALAAALIEQETLDGEEAMRIMKAHGLAFPYPRLMGGGLLSAVAAQLE